MAESGLVVSQPPVQPNAPVPGQGTTSDPLPLDVLDETVRGRPITGPDDGFGQLWRKRYRIRLAGVSLSEPEVVGLWRERFGAFWPEGNAFYRPAHGLRPDEVAPIDLQMPGDTRLSTGVVVADVQPTLFTFLTPCGHTFAGRVTFSAEAPAGDPVAQVESMVRANDPLYELALPFGGHAREDGFWEQTLRNLAAHFGVSAEPETTMELLDRRRQWRKAGNIRDNALLHTGVAMLARPVRVIVRRRTRRGGAS